jgi:hypothetical protein
MKYIKSGNRWSFTPASMSDIRDDLPRGNYTVCRDPLTREYYLESTADFRLPDRLYGNVEKYAARISKAFEVRNPGGQVGVLLSGSKGSGKTLLAKHLSLKMGLPTIIVNSDFHDESFMRTMQEIRQPCIVIIDEFEKLYDAEGQEAILTMFDGVYTLRDKLVIITCNDKFSVQSCFHNRPGRLRYSIDFSGLDVNFIEGYCSENLHDRSYLSSIVKFCSMCEEINFDMLQTLVSELNTVGGPFEEVVEILNVKPEILKTDTWDITVSTPDHSQPKWLVDGTPFRTSPLSILNEARGSGSIYLTVYQAEDNGKEFNLNMTVSDLVYANSQEKVYTFEVTDQDIRYRVSFRCRDESANIRRLLF